MSNNKSLNSTGKNTSPKVKVTKPVKKTTGKKATKKKVAKPVKAKYVPKVTTNDKNEKIVLGRSGRVWTKKESKKFFLIELKRASDSMSRLKLFADSSKAKASVEEQEKAKIIVALLGKAKDLFDESFA